MTMGRVRGWSLLSAALMGSTALMLAGPAAAQSKVGVTSATDGDPLGKPPAENERILRIGIDVQANEVVTTRSNDRAHLVFLDGTSLTVGPDARLTIDKFVYDPNTKTGDLAITASQGVLRLVGGKISKTNAIKINTPSSTIGIRGGIGVFGVTSGKTTAAFLFGNSMSVTGQGQTQTMTRANSWVIVNTGGTPSLPSLLPPGGINALMGALSLASNNSGKGSGTGGNADQKSQSSGFSNNNSGGQPPGGPPTTGNPPNVNNNTFTQVVSNTNPASNPTPQDTTPVSAAPSPPPPPPPPPTPKTTQNLTGYVGGLLVITEHHHRSVTTALSDARPGDLTINTNADTSTVTSRIIFRGPDDSLSVRLRLGTGRNGTSAFQDNLNFATATVNDRTTIRQGDERIRARDTSVLVTAAAVPGGSYVGTGCTCDFLTFGEWETVVTPHQRGQHGHGIVTQAPWIAGTLATQLPNTQVASFSGGMWGQAQNAGGSIRNVTGTFGINNYSFAAGSGQWVSAFDGRNYAGTVTGTPGGAHFGANSIPATTGYNTMSVNGSFFSSPTSNGGVAGVGGQFAVGGPGYLASGTFGGSKR
jgi:FecR protein